LFADVGRASVFLTSVEVVHCREVIVLHCYLVDSDRVGYLTGSFSIISRFVSQHATEQGDIGGSVLFT
jgi:hypothetical protein